jgi:ERCC4-related helicase
MMDLLRTASGDLASFLQDNLPKLSEKWWQTRVLDRLSFQQQRMAGERGFASLNQLDFAALLRVFDQNWQELSEKLGWPRDGRNWIKELQTIRNKWAHASSQAASPDDMYRDADTLLRLLRLIGAKSHTIESVEAEKQRVLKAMTPGTPAEQAIPSQESLGVREKFNPGDVVTLRADPSKELVVIKVIPGDGECQYQVMDSGHRLFYYESQLESAASATQADTPLSAETLRALLTSLQILSPSTASLFSFRAGRVQFVPYQYRPVLKLIRADRPRILIADEVGVGKTIEAGLIIKELRARADISSVLIICPKALVADDKWRREMKRFDEEFVHLDGDLLRHCLHETALEGQWPDQYAKAILPFSLFDSELVVGGQKGRHKKSRGLRALDPPPKFDLVIVDEAHHIRNPQTFLHQGVRYFCDNAQAVVLLTATPVQLGSEDLYTLLNVVRPDLVIDKASFEKMAEPNRFINEAVRHCRLAQSDWWKTAQASLDEVAETDWGRLFIRETPEFQQVYDRLGEGLLSDEERIRTILSIEQFYTFGTLINRTRRRDIGDFTVRKPETLSIEFTAEQKRLHDDLLGVIARILGHVHGGKNVGFMMTTIRRQAASCLYGLAPLLSDLLHGKLDQLEMMEVTDEDSDTDVGFVGQIKTEIEAMLAQARTLDANDPKADAFLRVLTDKGKLANNKALVFSTFRHTLHYLMKRLRETTLRVGLIHGGIQDDERAEIRRRFALPKADDEAIDVLLSSEVGCEGLDFQFCDFLVNYDLPWNPMRIEQRIGRIDRYGQKSETVAIKNLVTMDTVDADIYFRCLWRINVFHQAIGGSEEILGEITKELHDIADSFSLTAQERDERLKQLADNSILRIQEDEKLERAQAELFGLSIPKSEWMAEIEATESSWLSADAIQGCVSAYLSRLLGDDTDHMLGGKLRKTLRLNQTARSKLLEDFRRLPRSSDPVAREWERRLKGAEPNIPVTFDQATATENPGVAYLTVVHPLVRQAAQFYDEELKKGDTLHCCLSIESNELPTGIYPFAIYHWSLRGVRPDCRLMPVATNAAVETALLSILLRVTSQSGDAPLANDDNRALDKRHHEKWTDARATHIADNEQIIEQRIQSLKVSHQSRCRVIEDQLTRASDEKIRLMRGGELERARSDFERRMKELERAASTGDISFKPVVFGSIKIDKGRGDVRH